MKAEIVLPPELVSAIAAEVAAALKPLLSARKAEEIAILTPEALAERLDVSIGWIYEAVSQKSIPYFKCGKFLRFKKAAIDKWIEDQSTPAARTPTRPLRIVGGNPTR